VDAKARWQVVDALGTGADREFVATLPFVLVVSSAHDVNHFSPEDVVKDSGPDDRRE